MNRCERAKGLLLLSTAMAVAIGSNFALTASADVMIPPVADGVEGNGAEVLLTSNGGLVSQQFFRTADLTGLNVGDVILGIRLRLDGVPPNTPPSPYTWSRFDIKMGVGKTPVNLTNIFADNYIGVPQQVRTGPLTMDPGLCPTTGDPRGLSSLITFDTPYVYTGGILTLEVRNDGPAQPVFHIDAVSNTNTGGLIQYNIGDDHAPFANSSFFASNWAVHLGVAAVPEARAWLLVGAVVIGGAGVHWVRCRLPRP
jgi:hypothetical protein